MATETTQAVKAITENVDWLTRLAEDAERRLDNAMRMVGEYAKAYASGDEDAAKAAYERLLSAHSGTFN